MGNGFETENLRKVLRESLEQSGELLKKNIGKTPYRLKGPANLVTRTDEQAQETILNNIRRHFPDHNYLAEEGAVKNTGSEYTWVIDPLDGTTNFAHGFPVACVSIGILRGRSVLLGGIYDPFRDELFWAERGKGAYLNGRRYRASGVRRLRQALLITGFPYDRAQRAGFYTRFYRSFMEKCHDVRRSGSASLDLAWVSCGRVDGFWEFRLNPWDVAAGKLLVEEAGGRVTDFHNRPWPALPTFGKQTLATNGKIHAEMLRLLRAASP